MTEDMAQGLRVLAALAKDSGLVLSTQVVTHNYLEIQFQGLCCLLWPLGAPGTHMAHICTCRQILININSC